jgi:golgi phosphoprotein 3
MADLLLAEELLLIALDDEKGTTSSCVSLDPGLAGALLLDLLAEAALVEAGDTLDAGASADPSHPLLADALTAIRAEDEPKKPKHWIDRLPKAVKPIKGRVADGLVARGVLDEQRHKTLGLFPSTRYPEADPAPERELRDRLDAVLLHGTEPDAHTAQLVALVHALGLVDALVPKDQRKPARARAKAVAESSAVGQAVKRAIDDIAAAVVMVTTSGAIVAAST